LIGSTEGGLNTRLHAVSDVNGGGLELLYVKDWRRVATRYDRCPTVFFSAVALAATVIFWLRPVSSDLINTTALTAFAPLIRLE
jgi:hypothetical protein